jgi:CBS domain containing-hemolysin-like protein
VGAASRQTFRSFAQILQPFKELSELLLRLTYKQHLGLELPEDGSYKMVAASCWRRRAVYCTLGTTVEDDAGVFQIERVDKRRISRIRFIPSGTANKRQMIQATIRRVPL